MGSTTLRRGGLVGIIAVDSKFRKESDLLTLVNTVM